MPEGFGFLSRLFLVICAAVMLPEAARAGPAVPITQKRVKYSILRRQNTAQQVPSSAGLLYEENEVLAPADAHQSHPVPFTRGSFSYSQNSFDKTWPQIRQTKVQGAGMRPASSIFPTHSPYEGQSFDRYRIPQSSLLKKDDTGTLYTSDMNLLKHPQKSDSGKQIWKTQSSKVDKDTSARHLHYLLPLHSDELQSALSPTAERHGSGFKETKPFSTVRVQNGASKMQPRKILDFTSLTQGPAESLSNSLSVIRQNPSSQKAFVSEFPQNQHSVSNDKMMEHKRIQTHHFKGSPAQVYSMTNSGQIDGGETDPVSWVHKQSRPGGQVGSRTVSELNFFTRTDPNKQESEAPIGFRPRVILYPTSPKVVTPTPGFLHPASAEDKKWPSLHSVVQSHSQESRKTYALLNRVNSTSGELTRDNKLKQSVKWIHRLDGFRNSRREPDEETPGPSSADRIQSSMDKGKDLRFRFSNSYPYLSQKYSFGQRRVSVTGTLSKPDRVNTSSPLTQISFTSTAQPFTATANRWQAESGAIDDRNATENRFRLYKGTFGLTGFGIQPLEGANASPQSSETPIIPKPSFKGFELRSSEISRAKRVRINQRGENEPDDSKVSPTKELNSGNFKTPLNIVREDGSVSRFKYNHTNEYQSLQGFPPSKNRTGPIPRKTSLIYSEKSPLAVSKIASSSYLKTAGPPRDGLNPLPWPRAPTREQGVWLKTATRSVVIGKRVMGTQNGTRTLIRPVVRNATHSSVILRLPRVKAVTYADIVGSASFSSVRALGHHQDSFPNATIGLSSKDEVKNMSRSPQANVTDEKKAGENVERKEEADNEIEMSNLFSETEGSGGFDLSNVLLGAKENEQAGNDLLELEYLLKSTGNISFKSLGKSHQEQR